MKLIRVLFRFFFLLSSAKQEREKGYRILRFDLMHLLIFVLICFYSFCFVANSQTFVFVFAKNTTKNFFFYSIFFPIGIFDFPYFQTKNNIVSMVSLYERKKFSSFYFFFLVFLLSLCILKFFFFFLFIRDGTVHFVVLYTYRHAHF